MELINIVKSIIFIFWFMFSTSVFKQRKVTDVKRLLKSLSIICWIYVACIGTEIYFGIMFMYDLIHSTSVCFYIESRNHDPDEYFQQCVKRFGIVYTLYVLAFVLFMLIYVRIVL